MARIAVFGASGYLGRVVAIELRRSGHEVTSVRARRLRVSPDRLRRFPDQVFEAAMLDGVAVELLNHEVVVNAAGLPSAHQRTIDEVYGANAAWPLLVALACERAAVPHLIHLSSVAVQGMSSVLDDCDTFAPTDDYGASRVQGEQLLASVRRRGGLRMTIYRVPALYGPGRRPSYPLASLPRWLPLVVVGDGGQPVAMAHVDTVAAAVAVLAGISDPPTVVTHPAEGHTVRSIYRAYEPGRPVLRVSGTAVRAGLKLLTRFGDESRAASVRRRLGLALAGQRQVVSWLADYSFGAAGEHRVDHGAGADAP